MPDVSNIKDSLQWSRALKGARALCWFAALVTRLWDAPGPIRLGKVKKTKNRQRLDLEISQRRGRGDIGGHFSKERKKGGKEREVEMRAALWSTSSSQSRESWPWVLQSPGPAALPPLSSLPIKWLPQGFSQTPFVRLIPFHRCSLPAPSLARPSTWLPWTLQIASFQPFCYSEPCWFDRCTVQRSP